MKGGQYTINQGEPGTGKTTIGASTAHFLKLLVARRRPFPVVIVCPPHLVRQWPQELADIVPMAHAMEVRTIADLKAYFAGLQRLEQSTLSVAVISSEMLKRGSGWTPGVVRLHNRYRVLNGKGEPLFDAVRQVLEQYRATRDETLLKAAQGGRRRMFHSRRTTARPGGKPPNGSWLSGRAPTCLPVRAAGA